MNEALVKKVTEQVLARLEDKPRALCLGKIPENLPFLPVREAPYDAVILGSLSPAELLSMPSDPVCRALLSGIPVYLSETGLEHRKYASTAARTLYSLLLAKERQLKELGVRPLGSPEGRRLLTAEDVRKLLAQGLPLPPGARLTPLARDLWEGKP